MLKLLSDEKSLLQHLQKGADAAHAIADKTIKGVRSALNMV
jgi:hypothetical protein